jgi:Na+-transporting NADH:ubiquinone oxidoreductase subunit NqrA
MTTRNWIIEQKFKGGRTVVCRLCGKRATRVFNAANTNYAWVVRAAEEYAHEHEASDAHQAALNAFHGDDVPDVSSEDQVISEVFGQPLPSVDERRRRAARATYRYVKRHEKDEA